MIMKFTLKLFTLGTYIWTFNTAHFIEHFKEYKILCKYLKCNQNLYVLYCLQNL